MDIDFSFLDSEDFGLAKGFSTAPMFAIAPHVNFEKRAQEDIERPLESFVSEGFCFKMAPGQDVGAFLPD
jgi:hypothetical protein